MASLVDETFQFVSECVLFRNLGRREKEALFTRVQIRDFAPGESIFLMGSSGDNMMVVLRGKVRISITSPEGRLHTLAILSPGEMFGEIALLDGRGRSADATAMTACSLAVLARHDFLAFLERNPGAWHNIVSVLCQRLRRTDGHVAEIALLYDKNWRLAEASQHKSRFFAAANHDLRQPLHALGLFAAQLRGHMKSVDGTLLIDRIDTAVTAMNELFNALLDISKLDAGVLSPTVADFPIAALLAKIEGTFTTAAHQKGLSFRVLSSRAWVRSDPILMERILFNLVSNAVRYTDSGGVVVGCRRRGTTLHIEVWDSGPGIPEGQRRDIFGEFYRLADSGQGGLGLGLAIVERLCGLLGHPIDLISTLGKGSRFSVTVPVSEARPTSEPPEPTPVDIEVSRGKLVIVIDSDGPVLDGMGGLLRSWGCRVVTVATPADALANLGPKIRPDLIISDYHLTNAMTGIDAIKELRATYGEVPAFLMSGDTTPERLREALESGYHLLHKPVGPMALRAMINRLLKGPTVAGAP